MKVRLDVFLVEKGLYKTRNKAQVAIENGDILVDSNIVNKVSFQVDNSNNIEILKNSIPYVSRGGLLFLWRYVHAYPGRHPRIQKE